MFTKSNNLTFIIGNGFDLRVGLKTRYTDFYKLYTADTYGDSDLILRFKKTILQDGEHGWNNWADFEKGMGQQSEMFNGNADDFLSCFDDFAIDLNNYLKSECSKIKWHHVNNTIISEFSRSLIHFSDELITPLERTDYNNICFLQFNYTDVFDKLLQRSQSQILEMKQTGSRRAESDFNLLGPNLHIHGSLDKHPVIGVSDLEQIKDEKIRLDDSVSKVFLKRKFLNAIQSRNTNVPTPAKNAFDVIKNSTIICLYGTSIGDTDNFWWRKLGDWLKEGAEKRLVIFDVCGVEDDYKASPRHFLTHEQNVNEKIKHIRDRFCRLAGWQDEDFDKNKNKIIIELDTKMFNFKLRR